MASNIIPDDLLRFILAELPPLAEPTSNGGRRPIEHEVVVRVIWHVLTTGCRWSDVPLQLGCCGETARCRLRDWQATGVWERIHRKVLKKLNAAKRLEHEVAIIDSTLTRAFGGGAKSGPNPTDRAKPGTKYTLMVDANGVPLAIRTVGANVPDVKELVRVAVQFPEIGGQRGRPRTHPKQLIADAGYDDNSARKLLQWIGIEPRIRRRREKHGSHLGKVRWVVERTISWFKGLRRLRFRYDRDALMIEAWAKLAAAVITFRIFDNQ